MKKDTENLDILLLLKSQPLHRVAPFSVPSPKGQLLFLCGVWGRKVQEDNKAQRKCHAFSFFRSKITDII